MSICAEEWLDDDYVFPLLMGLQECNMCGCGFEWKNSRKEKDGQVP